jgi:hypothetical protein
VSGATANGLERTANAVSVWGYKLKWEIEDEETRDTVRRNLLRGVPYRYILPANDESRVNARKFMDLLDVPLDELPLEFRSRDDHHELVDTCITLYCFDTESDPLAIFFPLKIIGGGEVEEVFIEVSAGAARDLQRNFELHWGRAPPL